MSLPLSPKQVQFIVESNRKWNLAHGSVRTGKTVGTLFRFLQACHECPDSQIFMVGHSSETIYQNAIRLLLETPEFEIFRPFCTWYAGKRQLKFRDKSIQTLGAKDEGAIGAFQGKTFSLVYCDEMTLYPESIIDMIDTRLSKPHSMGFASMNPTHPDHKIKKWIDKAELGDKNYYELHFTLDDNPFITEEYKSRIRESLSGVFYKRNYLGLWCLAEGAIFDFFDHGVHVLERPPCAADYWIAGIDYGTVNPFACLLIGVSTGRMTQTGKRMWVEKEYYWNPKETGRQKTNSEYAEDIAAFLEPYGVKHVYIDPSAEAFQLELKRKGIHATHANNNVEFGIQRMTDEMKSGNLSIISSCKNTIREISGFVWDPKMADRGYDEPLKKDDHCFCEGTSILTMNGNFPIENVQVGDKVLTRSGWKSVLRTGSNIKEAKSFSIFGKKISCTSDHRFYTLNRGWVEISNLIQSDILCHTENQKSSSSMENDIDVIQKLESNLKEIISQETDAICIEISGVHNSEKYLKDVIYTTLTETPLTMMFPIFNVWENTNIGSCIRRILIQTTSQINVEMKLPSGIDHNKVENGIENMPKKQDLEVSQKENVFVKNVLPHSSHVNEVESDFVQISVSLHGEEKLNLILNKEYVDAAHMLLKFADSKKQNSALAPVLKDLGLTQVYNLEVEEDHEFFAEGFLVHNSVDALRYAIATHKISVYEPNNSSYNQNYTQNRFSPTSKRF